MYVDEMKKAGGLFNVTIELAGAYDDEKTQKELCDPETGDPYFVTLRELTGDEYRELMKLDDQARTSLLEKKVGDCLIAHNMRDSKRDIVSNPEAIAAIRQYGSIFYHVLQEWQKNIPLTGRTRKQSTE